MPFDPKLLVDPKLLAATALALALAACGSPAEEADEPVAGTEAVQTENVEAAEPVGTDEMEAAPEEVEPAEEADEAAEAEETASATPAPAARPAVTPVAAVEEPAMWAVCSACHAVEPGEHGIGPSLANVFGAEAASKPGFDYSDAMEEAGLTWNEGALDRYLADPRAEVPGTTMAYAGLKNDAQRQAMIEYLKTL